MTRRGRPVRGNSKTPTNSLKPGNIFHGGEHFSSVVFQVKSRDFLFQHKQHLAVSSGTWVPGVRGPPAGFSPSYFKGLEFLFLSSYRHVPALCSGGQRGASQPPWLDGTTPSRAVPHPPGLAFPSEVRGAEREMGKNITNQKEPEQGALCSPTKTRVGTRPRSRSLRSGQTSHYLESELNKDDACQTTARRTHVIPSHLSTRSLADRFPPRTRGLLSESPQPRSQTTPNAAQGTGST